ncbi:MAG: hypothetical protein QNJ74_09525 [Trichodesmium sp. MO_231.B1]|nr:hypothetical protein [Trichodesmium sp. MO_231.B1]
MLLIAHWVIVAGAALLGAAVGGTVGYFWDEIKAWANRVIGYIIDAVNYAIEVTSDAIVSLVKEGQRYYKQAEVYVMDVYTGKTRIESRQELINNKSDIPQEILEKLQHKAQYKLMERPT